jgi:FKBP-type peptidyl-prolyl cis-trans isomerase
VVDGGATEPITLDVSNVIAGLNEGIKGMKSGETRVLIIPPALAFGVKSSDPSVPDNATLIFFVKLESIT